jgi:hypothetical protein
MALGGRQGEVETEEVGELVGDREEAKMGGNDEGPPMANGAFYGFTHR